MNSSPSELTPLCHLTRRRIQPQLVLVITDACASLKFAYVGSVPLLPRTPARDVLIFTSRPESGLCARDAYSEESERNRKSALIRSASARSAQASADGHATSSPRKAQQSQGERRAEASNTSHDPFRRELAHSYSFRGQGSYTSHDHSRASNDFGPSRGGSSFSSHGPTRSISYSQLDGKQSYNYNESTFSRPSARTSLDRRTSTEKVGCETPTTPQPPAHAEKAPAASTTTPATTTPVESRRTSYNEFLYLPHGKGAQPLSNGHHNSGTFGYALQPAYSTQYEARRERDGAVMVYPPLSPAPITQSSEGHVPALAIDAVSAEGSNDSTYSDTSPVEQPEQVEHDSQQPQPPIPIMSPVSDISAPGNFVTPPSSPPLAPSPPPRGRSPNPYAVTGTPSIPAIGSPPRPPAPIPIPTRSPQRLPPIAAAHHKVHHQSHVDFPGSSAVDSNGNGHHSSGYNVVIKRAARDRATMLSRASVTSQDSRVSATSSRPPGVGSSRTRVKLTRTLE